MCDHALKSFKPPTASSLLFKEECTLCFDGQDSPEGIDVCLSCFNGSCPRKHTQTHHYKKQHSIYLNIKRTPKPVDPECRPEKMTKLSVQEKSVEYDFETELKCIPCGIKVEKGIGNVENI